MSDGPAFIGRTLADRYRIEAAIARGGMANVWTRILTARLTPTEGAR